MQRRNIPIIIEPENDASPSDHQVPTEVVEEGLSDLAIESTANIAFQIERKLATLQPLPLQVLEHPLLLTNGQISICDIANDFEKSGRGPEANIHDLSTEELNGIIAECSIMKEESKSIDDYGHDIVNYVKTHCECMLFPNICI